MGGKGYQDLLFSTGPQLKNNANEAIKLFE